MEQEIQLRKFDISSIKDDSIVVAIGRRRSGKSFCLKDMLSFKKDFPGGIVMSSTENANGFYSKFIPPAFVSRSEHFQPSLVEKFMQRQRDMKMKKERDPAYSDLDNRAFLIMDDMMYDAKSWRNDRNIKSIFMNGRHYAIFFLLTLQYSLGIPPDLRENVDYIFIFRQNKLNERRKLYEHWAGFMTYEVFDAILNQCTDDYGCIVIDNTTRSNRLEDQVFYYKAEDRGDFRMCPTRCWSYSEHHAGTDITTDRDAQHQQQMRQKRVNQKQYKILFR